jgi:hypothetical protein
MRQTLSAKAGEAYCSVTVLIETMKGIGTVR